MVHYYRRKSQFLGITWEYKVNIVTCLIIKKVSMTLNIGFFNVKG